LAHKLDKSKGGENMTLQPLVADSWKRSKKYGIDANLVNIKALNEDKFKILLDKNTELMQIARPVMSNLSRLVMGTAFTLVLSDAEGYIIENIGEERIKNKSLVLGTRAREEELGTNSIGTCIKNDKAIEIVGTEHYCKPFQKWACAAAPIHDENGKLIGVINMAGECKNYNKHTLGIAVLAANFIESQLLLHRSHSLIDTTVESISNGLIIANKDYIIKTINLKAVNILGISKEEAEGVNIKRIIPDLDFDDIIINNRLSVEKIYTDFLINDKIIPCNISINIIKKEKDLIGISLLFDKMEDFHQKVNILAGNKAFYEFKDIITNSEKMKLVIQQAYRFSKTSGNILIEGESGTGKELFAHSIHNSSFGKNGPFVAVNCASLPKDLIESELFGYEAGSFTGALKDGKPGKFELADGGTIFLDEIGEIPLNLQSKLLRFLDNHKVVRIGGITEKKLAVRVICATNRNLYKEVENKNFREDLFYRLNVLRINIPPLRERIEDVEICANYFLSKLNKANNTVKEFDEEFLDNTKKHQWKGNVRELQNIVQRSYYLSDSDIISKDYLPGEIVDAGGDDFERESQYLSKKEIEKNNIIIALKKTKGQIVEASEFLNISKSAIYRKINEYNINTKLYK